jgi:hypothetical protein
MINIINSKIKSLVKTISLNNLRTIMRIMNNNKIILLYKIILLLINSKLIKIIKDNFLIINFLFKIKYSKKILIFS